MVVAAWVSCSSSSNLAMEFCISCSCRFVVFSVFHACLFLYAMYFALRCTWANSWCTSTRAVVKAGNSIAMFPLSACHFRPILLQASSSSVCMFCSRDFRPTRRLMEFRLTRVCNGKWVQPCNAMSHKHAMCYP